MVLHDRRGGPVNGAAVWQSGYLPTSYQGTLLRSSGTPILNLQSPPGSLAQATRTELDLLRWTNDQHAGLRGYPDDLEARIAAYETAYRMQTHAPGIVDISDEPSTVLRLYGLDDFVTEPFGRQCLLARRMVERGVRYSLLVHGWENGVYSWDHHKQLREWLPARAREVDLPVAGLIRDLKARGLLDETLIVFTTEMSRTPFISRNAYGDGVGRDYHRHSMVTWLAGAGIKGGWTVGATDEFSLSCADEPVYVRDIHATILHLMGLDSDALTFLHEGRHGRPRPARGPELTISDRAGRGGRVPGSTADRRGCPSAWRTQPEEVRFAQVSHVHVRPPTPLLRSDLAGACTVLTATRDSLARDLDSASRAGR